MDNERKLPEDRPKFPINKSTHSMVMRFSNDPILDALQKWVGKEVTMEIGGAVIQEPEEIINDDGTVSYEVKVTSGVVTSVKRVDNHHD